MARALHFGATGAFLLLALTGACAGHPAPRTTADPAGGDISQLWIEPADFASRDWFRGAGASGPAPDTSAPFALVASDKKGYSAGYDVKDRHGVQWAVKVGREAQTEIVVSRILWGLGFHQPPTYLVDDWTLEGAAHEPGPARFRPDREGQAVVGEWSWYENPFFDAPAFKGLVVANLLLNNWDWKTSNNKVYELRDGQSGPQRVFVVRDVGASLGRTAAPLFFKWTPLRGSMAQGSRNDVEDFERQGFIKKVKDGRVEFDYSGIHHSLVDTLRPADVVWACELMARASDQQWLDAFRAAGYPSDIQQRYVAKVKAKIQEGLALR